MNYIIFINNIKITLNINIQKKQFIMEFDENTNLKKFYPQEFRQYR